MSSTPDTQPQPPAFNYVLGFLMVGIAWGFTTPFIRRAARDHNPPVHSTLDRADVQASWLKSKVYGAFFAVLDLLKNPRYAIPLLINLTGSVWFFLLIGQAGTSKITLQLLLTCNIGKSDYCCRAELDCTHREYAGVSLHSARRLVGREESHR